MSLHTFERLSCSHDSTRTHAEEEQASSLREDRQTNAAAATKMWAAVALRGISKNMKVAAAQRAVVSLRAQQCSLVGGHLDG